MRSSIRGMLPLSVLGAVLCVAGSGCQSMHWPSWSGRDACETCDPSGCDECRNGDACDCNEKGPKRWSEEWYAERSDRPIGARQVCKKGKLWPPFPRPTGPEPEASARFHAAHYWPYPYVCDDRAYVRNVCEMQVANGWMAETTLYDYHFDEETQELNHSGREHVGWMLRNVPPQRRTIYVQSLFDTEKTQKRLAATRNLVTAWSPTDVPSIELRTTEPFGRPANEIDHIERAVRGSMPEPRIQYQALPSGTGGSGG